MSPSIRLSYLLLLGISLILAWFGIHQLVNLPAGSAGGLVLLGAAMLLFAGLVAKGPQLLMAMQARVSQTPIARQLDPLVQTLFDRPLMCLGILAGAFAIAVALSPAFQPWPVLILWAAGLMLFLLGVAPRAPRAGIKARVARGWNWALAVRWELLAVLALTLLAFLLRGIALGSIPHNVNGDEGEMGRTARAIIAGDLRAPFSTAWLSHPTLWFFLQALALDLFGNNIAGLRMLSAIIGTLTVPALYVWARPLYGRTVAAIATALLAAYHFHVHYSRIGLNNIADALTIVLSLTAFFYGYRKRSPFGFAAAGVLIGIAQYFYFSSRFVLILVLALLVYLLLFDRRRLFALGGMLGLMLLGFVLAFGPIARYFIARPDTFSARLVDHGLLQNNHLATFATDGQSLLGALADHAYRSFGLFVVVDEHSPFYDAAIPLLDHAMGVLFILSVVVLLVNWRRLEMAALLLWVGGTALFGGFLLIDSPQSTRYVIAAPAVCIMMALALVQIEILLRQIVGLSPRLRAGAMSTIVLALMAWNIYFYFGIYTPSNRYSQTHAVTEIANYLSPQVRQRYVYMFTAPFYPLHYGTIEFVANSPQGTDIVEHLTSIAALPAPPAGLRPLFIFTPERLNELEIVKQRYGGGRLIEYRIQPAGDRTLMYIYEPAP